MEEESIVDRLQKAIKTLGMTPNSFATGAEVDASNLQKMLKGSIKVTRKTLVKLAEAYGLNIEWLTTGQGEMYKPIVQQTSTGDHSPNVNGNGNKVNTSEDFNRFLEELSAQRRLAEKSLSLLENRDAQVDRLIAILERCIPVPLV